MTDDKHIIWSDYNLNFEDWREDLAEQYPGLPESELIDIMYKTNADYLADERVNLDIQLSRPILIIADIGRWDGRLSGYKEIKSGNIKDCLYSDCDYATWFVDRLGDLRCDEKLVLSWYKVNEKLFSAGQINYCFSWILRASGW